MKILKKLDEVDDKYIYDLEQLFGINLPTSYKKFLIDHGGGIPEKNRFYKELESGGIYDFEIDVLMGKSKEEMAFDLLFNYSIFFDRIPKALVPISMDGIGNIICIGTEGEYYDKIYIWHMDEEANDDEEVTFENIDLLAESFKEFLEHLIESD